MLVNISLVRQEVAILMNECFVRYRKLNVLNILFIITIYRIRAITFLPF